MPNGDIAGSVFGGGEGGVPGIGPTAPFTFVNLAKKFFGGRRDFERALASQIANSARPAMARQQEILGRAGGTGSNLYKNLQLAQDELKKLTNTGDIQGIISIQPQLAGIVNEAQNVIQPIPGDFKYVDPRAGSPKFKGRFPAIIPFLQTSQFLDKLEGRGKVFTEPTGEVGPGRRPQTRELGQGYFIDTPVPGATGGGRGAFASRALKAARNPTFVPIDPLDIEAIRGRIGGGGVGVTPPQPGDPGFVGPIQDGGRGTTGEPPEDKVKRVIKGAARHFMRIPLPKQKFAPQGFTTRGFVPPTPTPPGGDFFDLEKEEDLIIPSGFTSKLATTQSRALALKGLR